MEQESHVRVKVDVHTAMVGVDLMSSSQLDLTRKALPLVSVVLAP